ncbi:MAG: protein-disulfide reductase DsbD domain-containing protein [Bacteroidota bacterium]
MRHLLLALTIFLGTSISGFGQILNPVKWNMEAKSLGESEYALVFSATIDDGWAVYSQFLEEDGPIPTTFEYDPGDHFSLNGKAEESGHRKESYDKVFEMKLIKFTETAVFTQKVKVTDTSKPITGYFTFMTCDDTRCLPPKDVDFSFDLSKVATEAAAPASGATEAPTKEAVAEEKTKESAPAEETVAAEASQEEIEEVAPAQQSGILKPVTWAFSHKQIDGQTYELEYRAKIQDGWYLYSQNIGEGGPIPTGFYLEEGDHYTAGEVLESDLNREELDDQVFEMKLIKFKKEAVFTQTVTVTDDSKPIVGYLEFMTCDDTRCLPPTEVDFRFALSETAAGIAEETASVIPIEQLALDGTPVDYAFDYVWAESDCGTEPESEEEESSNFLLIFLLGFGGGLIALLTPCVFPMIPLTVSFFTKSSKDRATGLRNAITYGLSIIVIYVFLGLVITGIFGADALNLLSTNAWFNIFFAVLFIVFAFSFFGYFEITLPSSWANRSDRAADQGGLLGIFFMAFTLSLVSFSCTGPIIGTLLVETATGGGPTLFGRIPLGPLMGMLGFSTALALPFALFAAFPGWLNSLPRSGGWMNEVKVTLGFVEIALALKFLSVADLTMGWNFLPYEAFVAVWVLCSLGLLLYFLGYIRFPHDSKKVNFGAGRIIMVTASLAAAVYFSLGFMYNEQSETFKTPNLLSGVAPPAGHSYIYPKECPLNIDCYKDFEKGYESALAQGKPILLDFTGHGCVNCRRMEDNVWGEDGIFELIRDDYVLVSLYVDDREKLEEPYTSPQSNRLMRNVGNKWADFQAIHFNRNSQPYYVLLAPNQDKSLKVLNQPKAYTPDKGEYQLFLECGLEKYQELNQQLGLK